MVVYLFNFFFFFREQWFLLKTCVGLNDIILLSVRTVLRVVTGVGTVYIGNVSINCSFRVKRRIYWFFIE